MLNHENLFTLIICTFNRSEWLIPTLKTLAAFRFKIIVMDGSNDSTHLEKNQISIDNLNEINHNFIRYFANKGSYLARLKIALFLVDTPYCKISADDDLFSAEFVNDAITKLQLNPKIATVDGGFDSYDINERHFLGFTEASYHSDLASPQMLKRGVTSGTLLRAGTFGVMPVKILQLCSKFALDAEEFIVVDSTNEKQLWAAGWFTEIIFRNIPLFIGIIAKSEHLMVLRFYHGENLGSKLARNNKLSTFFLDKRIQSHMEVLCDRIALELKLPINDVRSIIFFDHFSNISRRLQIIKGDILSSTSADILSSTSRSFVVIYCIFIKKMLKAPIVMIRLLFFAVEEMMKGRRPAKIESLRLLKIFLINFDSNN
jgi:glycosyltransferase domain-containing protein